MDLTPTNPPDKGGGPPPLQVLMIEDNETDAFLTTATLRRAGFNLAPTRVDSEADLRAALEKQPWDIILCDFTIPGFGGREALGIAKEQAADTPFIFVSGTIGEEAVAEAMRSGAQDYVMKDRLKRLAPAIARELHGAAVRREARQADRWMRESEHKYRQLFDALHEAIFVIDEKSGRIIDTNRQAEDLLQRPRAAIVGVNHATLFSSPAGSVVLDELRAIAADRTKKCCILQLAQPDKSALPLHASASPIELYGRPFLLVLMHERAEQRAASAPAPLNADQIVAAVAKWPDEAADDLLARIALLRQRSV